MPAGAFAASVLPASIHPLLLKQRTIYVMFASAAFRMWLQTRLVSARSLLRSAGCQLVASGAAAEVHMELAAQLAVTQVMTSTERSQCNATSVRVDASLLLQIRRNVAT
jgi:hypothetical protein